MDLASAFDLTLDGEIEAKFSALKNLQAKKIKLIASTIEQKDKEIAKLKLLSQDNRRTQMINALKDKLDEYEAILNYLKIEFTKNTELSMEDVNNMIIKKTLDGPKTFRPATREEMENRIIDLEKKIKKVSSSNEKNSVSGGGSANSSRRPSIANDKSSLPEDVQRMGNMLAEINSLKTTIKVKDQLFEQQKGEIVRLKLRNAELKSLDEEANFQESTIRELKASNDRLHTELDSFAKKIAELTEENMILQSDNELGVEQQHLELEGLQDQCERLLQQNASLLGRMAELESELERTNSNRNASPPRVAGSNNPLQEKLVLYETKNKTLTDKLKDLEKKFLALKEDNAANINQKENIVREKNLIIRDRDAEIKRLNDKILSEISKRGSNSDNADVKKSFDASNNVANANSMLLTAQKEIERLELLNSDLKKQLKNQSTPSTQNTDKSEYINLLTVLMDHHKAIVKNIINDRNVNSLVVTPQSLHSAIEKLLKICDDKDLMSKLSTFSRYMDEVDDQLPTEDDEELHITKSLN